MTNDLKPLCLLILMCGTSSFAVAAPEEIQVYMDEMDAPGQYGLDLHTNTVPSGNDAGTYPGVLPSAHLFRFTPEFSYGLTPNLELGAYVLSTDNATTGAQVDGGKVRIKFIAPKTTDQIYFWGANFEIGKVSAQLDPNPWNAELKGIFGLRYSGWTFAVNSNLDWVVSGPVPAPTTVEWDTKLAYAVTHVTQLGFESYNGLGVANNLGNLNQYSQMLYGVIDTSMDKWDLNLGIGRGLNAVSDQWVLKAIIGVPID